MDLDDTHGRIAVGVDNQQAGYDMANTLLASGKEHVVYFGSMSDARDQKRYQGYRRAMDERGLTPLHITPNNLFRSIGAGMLAMARQLDPQTNAILCTNDDIAVGVLQECLKLGIRVPQDMAISGFHGLDIGLATTPLLASVITPRFEMGKVVAEILLKKIKNLPTIRVDLHYRSLLAHHLSDLRPRSRLTSPCPLPKCAQDHVTVTPVLNIIQRDLCQKYFLKSFY